MRKAVAPTSTAMRFRYRTRRGFRLFGAPLFRGHERSFARVEREWSSLEDFPLRWGDLSWYDTDTV